MLTANFIENVGWLVHVWDHAVYKSMADLDPSSRFQRTFFVDAIWNVWEAAQQEGCDAYMASTALPITRTLVDAVREQLRHSCLLDWGAIPEVQAFVTKKSVATKLKGRPRGRERLR